MSSLNISEIDYSKIEFNSEKKPFKIKNENSEIYCKSISIKYNNGKKTVPFCIKTPILKSLGIRNSQYDTEYNILTFVLFKDNVPTNEEKQFFDCITKITKKIKDYLKTSKVKDKLELYDDAEIEKLSMVGYGKDKGKVLKDKSPFLSVKLYNNPQYIVTKFFDSKGNFIPKDDLKKMFCDVRAEIIIENIFYINSKLSIQVKLAAAQIIQINPIFESSLLKQCLETNKNDIESNLDDLTSMSSEDFSD